VLLSFSEQKKQYDFFGFGEEIGSYSQCYFPMLLFPMFVKIKDPHAFFFEIKLNLCLFKKNIMFKCQSILSYEKSFYYKRINLKIRIK
jgi:hypothetical protein